MFVVVMLDESSQDTNRFEICTSHRIISTIRGREEIGRGLRLGVNQQGQHNRDLSACPWPDTARIRREPSRTRRASSVLP